MAYALAFHVACLIPILWLCWIAPVMSFPDN